MTYRVLALREDPPLCPHLEKLKYPRIIKTPPTGKLAEILAPMTSWAVVAELEEDSGSILYNVVFTDLEEAILFKLTWSR